MGCNAGASGDDSLDFEASYAIDVRGRTGVLSVSHHFQKVTAAHSV